MKIKYVPRRLRPFDWQMCAIKLIGAPVLAFFATIALIGWGQPDMLHTRMENGQVIHEDKRATPEAAQDAYCDRLREDAPTNAWAAHVLTERPECHD